MFGIFLTSIIAMKISLVTQHRNQREFIERMILASSNKGDTILDPFLGSKTTLRVCQQLDRKGIGIELNPEYVRMAKDHLKKPFSGFDSIDPRMRRVPLDLRKKKSG